MLKPYASALIWGLCLGMAHVQAAHAKPKGRAKGEPADCGISLEAAQDSQKEGKQGQARDFYKACAVESCTKSRVACQKGLDALPAKLPGVVVHLEGIEGKPSGLKIYLDDKEVTGAPLDSPIELPVGEHALRIVAEGYAEQKLSVSVAEADSAKPVVVSLRKSADGSAAASAEAGSGSSSGSSSLPWILAGSGAVFAGAGAALYFTAPALPTGCDPDANPGLASKKCIPGTSQSDQDQAGSHDNYTLLGTGMMAVGGAALVGGIVWGVMGSGESGAAKPADKPSETKLYGAPLWLPGGGGFGLGGRF